MHRLCLLALLLLTTALPANGQYEKNCVVKVNNTTVHADSSADLTLPNGSNIEVGDTIAVRTEDGVCAGYGVWKETGVTLAAAGSDSLQISKNGYEEGEYLRFEVFDVSENTTVEVGTAVEFVSCGDVDIPICREAKYTDGGFHQIKSFNGTPIPVDLAYFRANVNENQAVFQWKTFDETRVSGFEVQHKEKVVAEVSSKGSGKYKATTPWEFQYGEKKFKLLEVRIDGVREKISEAIIRYGVDGKFEATSIYPNPIRNEGSLQLTVSKDQTVKFQIYDILGRSIQRFQKTVSANETKQVKIEAPGSGKYFVRIIGENFEVTRTFVVIQ